MVSLMYGVSRTGVSEGASARAEAARHIANPAKARQKRTERGADDRTDVDGHVVRVRSSE